MTVSVVAATFSFVTDQWTFPSLFQFCVLKLSRVLSNSALWSAFARSQHSVLYSRATLRFHSFVAALVLALFPFLDVLLNLIIPAGLARVALSWLTPPPAFSEEGESWGAVEPPFCSLRSEKGQAGRKEWGVISWPASRFVGSWALRAFVKDRTPGGRWVNKYLRLPFSFPLTGPVLTRHVWRTCCRRPGEQAGPGPS